MDHLKIIFIELSPLSTLMKFTRRFSKRLKVIPIYVTLGICFKCVRFFQIKDSESMKRRKKPQTTS